MTAPDAILHEQVATVVATEAAIALGIEAQSELTSRHAPLQSVLSGLKERSAEQRRRLEDHLGAAGTPSASPASAISSLLSDAIDSGRVERVLSADYAGFALAAAEYALLMQLSLRLFDPSLREIAPAGLKAYTEAMQRLTDVLPGVVVEDLDERGLDCRCICPMCALGACGCTAAGEFLVRGSRHQVATGDAEAGLVLSRPRVGSQLAGSDVLAGDRLVEVDGQPIASFLDVQKALRGHALGEEVTLLISRGSHAPREVRVKHVSDYQPG